MPTENRTVTKSADIANCFKDYYSALYNLPDQMSLAPTQREEVISKFIADSSLPKRTCDKKIALNKPISEEELIKALRKKVRPQNLMDSLHFITKHLAKP